MSDMLQLVVMMRNIESGTALVAGVTQRQAEACRTFARLVPGSLSSHLNP